MNKKVSVLTFIAIIFLVGCGNKEVEQVENTDVEIEQPVNDVATPPEGCISWFDGCNMCSIGASADGPMACTMMACVEVKEPYCARYEDGSSDAPIEIVPVSIDVEKGIKNSIYKIENEDVTLVDGKAEVAAAPGSATKIVTQTTNFMAEGDLQQGTGATLDGAVVLMQDSGGSGTFYYVGVIIEQLDGTYIAANETYLLGDRILIKDLRVDERMVYVTYLVREDDEPMNAMPTIEITKQYATKGNVLMDVTPVEPIVQEDVLVEQKVGDDKDEKGCIRSAGYTWSEERQDCIRSWEEK